MTCDIGVENMRHSLLTSGMRERADPRNLKLELSRIITTITVNVDNFARYIFLRNSRFLDIRENIYTSKITFITE